MGRIGGTGRMGRTDHIMDESQGGVGDRIGTGALAVRAMAAGVEHCKRSTVPRIRRPGGSPLLQRRAQCLQFAWFRARIPAAMYDKHRHLQPGQPAAIKLLGSGARVPPNPQPRARMPIEELPPALTVIAGHHRGCSRSDRVGIGDG